MPAMNALWCRPHACKVAAHLLKSRSAFTTGAPRCSTDAPCSLGAGWGPPAMLLHLQARCPQRITTQNGVVQLCSFLGRRHSTPAHGTPQLASTGPTTGHAASAALHRRAKTPLAAGARLPCRSTAISAINSVLPPEVGHRLGGPLLRLGASRCLNLERGGGKGLSKRGSGA